MKNKVTTISLLFAVIFIWSWVVYKFYNGLSDSNDFLPIATSAHIPTEVAEFEYSLHKYDKDPFLSILSDTSSYIPEPIKPEIKRSSIITEKPKEELPEYCGTIQNNDQKKIAIIRSKGRYSFLSEREKFNDYTIYKIKDENLIILRGSEKITLNLKKQNTEQ